MSVAPAFTLLALRWHGALEALSPDDRRALFQRSAGETGVRERTAHIVAQVRGQGDAALRALALELDGVTLDAQEVPRRDLNAVHEPRSASRCSVQFNATNEPLEWPIAELPQHAHPAALDPFEGMFFPGHFQARDANGPEAPRSAVGRYFRRVLHRR